MKALYNDVTCTCRPAPSTAAAATAGATDAKRLSCSFPDAPSAPLSVRPVSWHSELFNLDQQLRVLNGSQRALSGELLEAEGWGGEGAGAAAAAASTVPAIYTNGIGASCHSTYSNGNALSSQKAGLGIA